MSWWNISARPLVRGIRILPTIDCQLLRKACETTNVLHTGIRESAAQAYAQILDAQGYDTTVRLYLFGVDILTV